MGLNESVQLYTKTDAKKLQIGKSCWEEPGSRGGVAHPVGKSQQSFARILKERSTLWLYENNYNLEKLPL